MRVLVIDTETTGLSPGTDRLIEVAYALYDVEEGQGAPVELASFSALINPQIPLPAAVTTLTGLKPEHVARGCREAEAVSVALDAMGKSDVVMAWNASFDRTMLEAAAARASVTMPSVSWRCALQAARDAHPEWPRHRLKDALQALKLTQHHNSHRALDDARAAFAVWWQVTSPPPSAAARAPSASSLSSSSSSSLLSSLRPPLWRRLFQ